MADRAQRLPFFTKPDITSSPQQTSHQDYSRVRASSSTSLDHVHSQPAAATRSHQHGHLDEHESNEGNKTPFERHAETTNIELFYDLFFVANLTVFSGVKEVNSGKTLSQYIGFFTILWFTWYQVSLYDVRFQKDTILNRAAKVVQFGVMIGFAVVGPKFNPGENVDKIRGLADDLSLTDIPDPQLTAFKSLTLIMMVSRVTLVLQYLQAMWISRKYPGTVFPMSLVAGTELIAALIYGLLFIAFKNLHVNAYIVWYVVAILETIICTAVSIVWRKISFKGTHLVQRMGLLTLIILGEGIMGLAETCQKLVKAQLVGFTGTTISDISCAIMILYFLYMMYFDWVQEHHMGSIRQQFWAILHFFLHVSLLLTLSGVNQFISWRAATVSANNLWNQALLVNSTDTLATFNGTVSSMMYDALVSTKNIAQYFYFNKVSQTMQSSIATVNQTIDSTNSTDTEEAYQALYTVVIQLNNVIYTVLGFEPPHANDESTIFANATNSEEASDEATNELNSMFVIARLIVIYFFVCVGTYIIFCGVIAWIGKRNKDFGDRTKLSIKVFIGSVTALLAVIVVGPDAFYGYVDSPWILPTVTLILLVTAALRYAPLPETREDMGRKLHRRKAPKRAPQVEYSHKQGSQTSGRSL